MSSVPSVAVEVQNLKDDTSKKAEYIVFTTFPKKVKELSDALQGSMFAVEDLSVMHAADLGVPVPSLINGTLEEVKSQPGTKRKRLEEDDVYPLVAPKRPALFSGEVSSNPKLEAVIDFLKPEVIASLNSCSSLKLWIQLMIPKIEDGNNFGVSIQEDILSEVTKAESDISTYLDQMSRYFTSRAKMVSKLAKYPHLKDYRRAVNEYDEKVFFSFKLILTELRNIYVVLYDVIQKNYEKLIKPRNVNTNSLY